ncbi:MAG: hypothetical protein IT385_26300 [Deltaproteobacteria bacterium]|nr:hypothetical protein [Deltaproteobacteria bacterium]
MRVEIAFDPGAENPRRSATNTIAALREQKLLARIDASGMTAAGTFPQEFAPGLPGAKTREPGEGPQRFREAKEFARDGASRKEAPEGREEAYFGTPHDRPRDRRRGWRRPARILCRRGHSGEGARDAP